MFSESMNLRPKLYLLFIIIAAGANQFANAAVVKDIRWDTKPEYTRCVVELSQAVPFKDSDRVRNGNFYVDLYNITKPHNNLHIDVDNGVIDAIQVANYEDKKVLRLIFFLGTSAAYKIQLIKNPDRIVIDILHPKNAKVRPRSSNDISSAKSQAKPRAPIHKKLILIDPGHGGSDPGCLSSTRVGGRTIREKDLTLKTALALKKLIDKSPNLEARLTRKDDRYVSLDDRIRIAEQIKADLFISIHYNSTEKRNAARGLELYVLDQGRAVREASTIVSQLSKDRKMRSLLKKMMVDKFNRQIRQSSLVCRLMEDEFLKNSYFKRYNRGIKDENFRVLRRQYDRPTVLVEIGYLSHASEVKQMTKSSNQKTAASCIYNAVNRYFKSQTKEFKTHLVQVPR